VPPEPEDVLLELELEELLLELELEELPF